MRSIMVHKHAELLFVILIIAVLAVLQMKSYMPVTDSARLLHTSGAVFQYARLDSVIYNAHHGEWPQNNEQALMFEFGMNTDYLSYNDTLEYIQLEDGAVTMKFNEFYPEKIITFRPAVPTDDPFGPLIWVCGSNRSADEWLVYGEDRTNIEDRHLTPYIK